MRITINLASRPFADYAPAIRRLRIAIGLLALAAVALGGGLYAVHQQAQATRDHERALDAQLATLHGEQSSFKQLMARPENALVLAQVATLNKLFDEKAFSWTLAMEDLETVLPAGVQVSNLEPVRDKTGKITLHMMVAGPRDRAVELVRNLERSKRFLLPRIVGENSESTNRPGQPLEPVAATNRANFDLLVDYNPVSDDEAKEILKKQKPTADKPAAPGPAAKAKIPLQKTGGAR